VEARKDCSKGRGLSVQSRKQNAEGGKRSERGAGREKRSSKTLDPLRKSVEALDSKRVVKHSLCKERGKSAVSEAY
jgi:hypothetical protein